MDGLVILTTPTPWKDALVAQLKTQLKISVLSQNSLHPQTRLNWWNKLKLFLRCKSKKILVDDGDSTFSRLLAIRYPTRFVLMAKKADKRILKRLYTLLSPDNDENFYRELGFKGRFYAMNGEGVPLVPPKPILKPPAGDCLYIGEFDVPRNFGLLLEAFSSLPYKLTVVAQGPRIERLRDMLPRNITIQPFSELASLMRDHKAVITMGASFGHAAEMALCARRLPICQRSQGVVAHYDLPEELTYMDLNELKNAISYALGQNNLQQGLAVDFDTILSAQTQKVIQAFS